MRYLRVGPRSANTARSRCAGLTQGAHDRPVNPHDAIILATERHRALQLTAAELRIAGRRSRSHRWRLRHRPAAPPGHA